MFPWPFAFWRHFDGPLVLMVLLMLRVLLMFPGYFGGMDEAVCWAHLGLVHVTYIWDWLNIYLDWVPGLCRINFKSLQGMVRVYLELL